jgi:hypothetical protein
MPRGYSCLNRRRNSGNLWIGKIRNNRSRDVWFPPLFWMQYPCHILTMQYPCHIPTMQYSCRIPTMQYSCHIPTIQYSCHVPTIQYSCHIPTFKKFEVRIKSCSDLIPGLYKPDHPLEPYRVYLKGLYKLWGWVLLSRTIHKSSYEHGSANASFSSYRTHVVRGAPLHFSLVARGVLNSTYCNRWIGWGGPTAWPPRSPDSNPVDFCVWGHLKALVHSLVKHVETIQQGNVNGCHYRWHPRHLWTCSTVNDTTCSDMY